MFFSEIYTQIRAGNQFKVSSYIRDVCLKMLASTTNIAAFSRFRYSNIEENRSCFFFNNLWYDNVLFESYAGVNNSIVANFVTDSFLEESMYTQMEALQVVKYNNLLKTLCFFDRIQSDIVNTDHILYLVCRNFSLHIFYNSLVFGVAKLNENYYFLLKNNFNSFVLITYGIFNVLDKHVVNLGRVVYNPLLLYMYSHHCQNLIYSYSYSFTDLMFSVAYGF